MEKTIIRFRPHHFMCTLGFRGKGYSLDFIRNYKQIVNCLNNDEDTLIEIVEYMDDICAPCPNRIDSIKCKAQDEVINLDSSHTNILKLKVGEIISWKEALNRIKKYMSIDKFNAACAGCEWKKYGVCQDSLLELINS